MIHTIRLSEGEPTCVATVLGTMKMPDPIIAPIITAVPVLALRTRSSLG